MSRSDIFKEALRLQNENASLRSELERLKNEMYSEEDVVDLKTAIVAGQNVNRILSETLSRYRQALIWAIENGDYADMSSRVGPKDEWDDELRRRVGEQK